MNKGSDAGLDHPAVHASLKMLRERYERARCDDEGVAGCVRCNIMFLVNRVSRALTKVEDTE